MLDYTLALWEYRNGIVHGQHKEEVKEKAMQALRDKLKKEYNCYVDDPFYVSRNKSCLFDNRSLHQRLKQDRDTLTC